MTQYYDELLALQTAGAAIASSPDLQYVLVAVTREMLNLLNAEGCTIFLLNQDQETMSLLAEHSSIGERDQPSAVKALYLADFPLIKQTLAERRAHQIIVSQAEANSIELTYLHQANLKTLLVLPMECYNRVIGVVKVEDGQVERNFTIQEIGLAQLLANQTASTIENARLYQAEQSRRQELEAVQQISLSLTASLELAEVLEAILNAVLELAAAEEAQIFLYNEDRLTFGAARGKDSQPEQVSIEPQPTEWTYAVAEQGEPIIVTDTPFDPRKVLVGLPLRIGQRIVGVMNIFYAKAHAPLAAPESRVLRLLVDQAAIGIENARLYAKTERQVEQFAVLHELDRAISASLHLEDVYHAFARHAARLIAYHRTSINLLEENRIHVAYVIDKDNTVIPAGTRLPLKSSAAGWVVNQGQPLLRHNILADSRFIEDEQLVAVGIQADMIIPLRFKRQVIGAWNICSRQRGAYDPDDLEIAQAIADQLANAIENARLYKQARQEINERKQAEAALRASEERFRQVISSITDWIYVTKVNENGSRVNLYLSPHVETLTGYPYDNFITDWQFWPSVVVHPDDRAVAAEQAVRLVSDQSSETEYRLIRADGEIIWVRDSARVESEGTNAKIIYGVVSNITGRKQLEEQFHQLQKMEAIGRLAGGVAHDFNNLLTVINGYSELLLHRYLDNTHPIYHFVEEIKKAGERAASLTGQLLAFSRKQVLQPKVLDLNEVLADMDKMLRRLIGEDINLLTIPKARVGWVKADPGQVEQVIMNLAINARDAMPHGGKLTIETANVILDEVYTRRRVGLEPGPYVVLTVSDTGRGMEPETLSHIFEPFFTTKEKYKGTGLGLATVYGVVTQSGGHIDVSSRVGVGTTFKIYLPPVEQAAELPPENELPDAPHGHETILLVEDEDLVRDLTRTVLLRYGYHVLEASYGSEALSVSQQYEGGIDLLATDVVMPQMSGRELAERLLLLRPNIKILYMSGYTEDTVILHGILQPDVAFLQKPFTPRGLARKVRQVLDG